MCSKVGCGRSAERTLSYDYADSLVAIGPLGLTPDPHSYDLCRAHADSLRIPRGWTLMRYREPEDRETDPTLGDLSHDQP
ncbi:hypothetical protein FM119_10795 [Mycetocola reblochoni REB411]|uniref:DUF3499 domain-containing protein n=1 Tax=Mycetocola reblochoni REB411 TaxID=1255698 RepID=A0A1R4K1C6_9MICO|nr:hypothetical protein FM119_10795 [Mycetocola reblochoni REB411]